MGPKDIKKWFLRNEKNIVLVLGGILIALISFFAGRLIVLEEEKIPLAIEKFETKPEINKEVSSVASKETTKEKSELKEAKEGQKEKGPYVGSVNSNKYHPVEGCRWANRIKEENKIYFKSREEAEAAGYKPSSCFQD